MVSVFTALAAYTAHVAVFGVSLELNEHVPHRGVGDDHVGAGVRAVGRSLQGLGGTVPAAHTARGGGGYISGELEVLQVRAYAQSAVGLVLVADTGQSLERHLIHTVSEPVAQQVFRAVTEVKHRLLLSHAAFVFVGVTQLIVANDLLEGLHTFFVTLQGTVASYTVTDQIGE